MDLNQLYFAHQLDLLKAASGSSNDQRKHHLASADRTAMIIAGFQRALGATVPPMRLHSLTGAAA